MTDLRLVLLLAGALALALVWLLDLRRERKSRRQRTVIRSRLADDDLGVLQRSSDDNHDLGEAVAALPPISPTSDESGAESGFEPPDAPQFIAIHVKSAHQTPFITQSIFAAAESAGLFLGDTGIFLMPGATSTGPPLFSLVNMLEPGTFARADPTRSTRGLTLIMRLPAESNPTMVLDLMLHTADLLATSLGGSVYGTDHRLLDKGRIAALRHQAAGTK